MRIVQLNELTDEMTLARPVYQKLGLILLSEGTSKLMRFKEKFTQLDIHYLYVNDKISDGIEIDDVVSEETRAEGRRIVSDTMSKLMDKKQDNINGVYKIISSMIDEILSNKAVVVNLMDLKNKEMYLYYHAVNVATLSLVIGTSLGYAPKQLNYLGTGAILHDIGMAALPKPLIAKSEMDMTPEERKIYRAHPQLGYEMMRSLRDVDAFSKNIVLGHHEQVDGEGYPRKVGGSELHEMVKIVAVCDAYDTLTSLPSGGKIMPSYQAIEYLMGNIGKKFDRSIVAKFVRHVAAFPVGSIVTLNDKRKGIIERQNEGFPTRPVVRLIDTPDLAAIDLLKEVSIVIENVR